MSGGVCLQLRFGTCSERLDRFVLVGRRHRIDHHGRPDHRRGRVDATVRSRIGFERPTDDGTRVRR